MDYNLPDPEVVGVADLIKASKRWLGWIYSDVPEKEKVRLTYEFLRYLNAYRKPSSIEKLAREVLKDADKSYVITFKDGSMKRYPFLKEEVDSESPLQLELNSETVKKFSRISRL